MDTPMILQFAAIAEPDDVLVLLSHTGRWPEFARAARMATKRGATVVAITNSESDLAKAASILFPAQVIEDTSVFTPMSSRLAQLALLDAIHVVLALTRGPSASDRLRRSKDALRPGYSGYRRIVDSLGTSPWPVIAPFVLQHRHETGESDIEGYSGSGWRFAGHCVAGVTKLPTGASRNACAHPGNC